MVRPRLSRCCAPLPRSRENATDPWGDCGYRAWRLPLRPGQNTFGLSLWRDGNATGGCGGSGGGAYWGLDPEGGEGQEGPAGGCAAPEQYSLAVVRLAEPEHTALHALRIRAADGSTVAVCADPPQGRPPAAGVLRQFSSKAALLLPAAAEVKPCTPVGAGGGSG